MTFRGILKDGKIELDTDVRFPEGTEFEIQPARGGRGARRVRAKTATAGAPKRRLGAADVYRLAERAVSDPRLPGDLASELDHYVYGTPKRAARRRGVASPAKTTGRPRAKGRKPPGRRGR